MTLRTKETEDRYTKERALITGCPFCEEDLPKERFVYWNIRGNKYPYDGVFSVSDLLVCKRHVEDEEDLEEYEKIELRQIRKDVLKGGYYSCWMVNSKPCRTVKPHLHYHLLKF